MILVAIFDPDTQMHGMTRFDTVLKKIHVYVLWTEKTDRIWMIGRKNFHRMLCSGGSLVTSIPFKSRMGGQGNGNCL